VSSAQVSELQLSKLNANRLCHFIFIILFLFNIVHIVSGLAILLQLILINAKLIVIT